MLALAASLRSLVRVLGERKENKRTPQPKILSVDGCDLLVGAFANSSGHHTLVHFDVVHFDVRGFGCLDDHFF